MAAPHDIIFSAHSVQIVDSWNINNLQEEKDYIAIIKANRKCPPEVYERCDCSLIAEWRTHNLLYALGIARERTKSTDFDKEPWYRMLCYYIALPFTVFNGLLI